MKLVLTILLITFTFSNAFLFRGPQSSSILEGKNDAGVEDYFTAYYAHFGLKKPEQLLKCFDKVSTGLYFKQIGLFSDLVQHAEARDKHKVHLDFVKIAAVDKALYPLNSCVAKTQDVQDLFNALNITDRNPELLGLNSFIHYQAEFGKLSKYVPQVVAALNLNNYTQAGQISACILNHTVDEIQNKGTALLALKGLWNGVHIGIELPDAESIFSCWNNDTAAVRLEFIYGMANAVVSGLPKNAAYNTEKWYEEKGNDLVKKIPEDAWKCWHDSADVKKESDKLGVDLNSKDFYDKGRKFVYGNQHAFWSLQKLIKDNLEQHNFIHAGSAYGHLMQAIAKTHN